MRELKYNQNRFRGYSPVHLASAFVLVVLSFYFIPDTALAAAPKQTLGDSVINVLKGTNLVPGVITGLAYLIGLLFGVSAILKLRDHVEKGDNAATIWEPVKRFAAGGAMFALPTLAGVLQATLIGSGGDSFNYSGFAGEVTNGGLDEMMVRLVKDLWDPLHFLFAGFSYIAGAIFLMIGIQRLIKTSQDGPKGPGGFGTIMTFVTSAALFSSNSLMAALMNTVFGDATSTSSAVLRYGSIGLSADEQLHVQAVISAVVGFVALVGWISFIRGWLILRGVGEGNNQASMMAAITHIVAGVLCVNIGGVLNAVQVTLGIDHFGVTFQ